MADTALAFIRRHRLLTAPFLGLLGGFLCNRAHAGSAGVVLLAEMAGGAAVLTLGACVLGHANDLAQDEAKARALQLARRNAEESERRERLQQAEAERFRAERTLRDQMQAAAQHVQHMRAELERSRGETAGLQRALTELAQRVLAQDTNALSRELNEAGARIVRLEDALRAAEEARARAEALEAAQAELAQKQVELDRRTAQEAEEVKASLLRLAVSDSQRRRNVEAPEGEQSGRIIELEARIKRLAREIERLSARQPVAAAEGEASLVAAGGTGEQAKIGFLKAMLEANQTLRRRIKAAA